MMSFLPSPSDVEDVHIRAVRHGELVKFPGRQRRIGERLLPPTAADEDVEFAVAVDVAGAEAGGRNDAFRGSSSPLFVHVRIERPADGDFRPRFGRILARHEKRHLPLVPEQKALLAEVQKIDEKGRFVAGRCPES